MSRNPRLSWVYTLQKPALVEVARNYGLIDDGLVPELRQRIVNYLQETPIIIPSQHTVLPTHDSSVVLTRRERRCLRVQQFQERLRKADKDRLINAPMVKSVSVVPEVLHMSPKMQKTLSVVPEVLNMPPKVQKLEMVMPHYKNPTVTNNSSRFSVAPTQKNVPVVPDSSAPVVVQKGLSRRERHKLRAQKYYESLDKRKKDSLKSLHLLEDMETSSKTARLSVATTPKNVPVVPDGSAPVVVPKGLSRRERHKLRAQKYYENLDKLKKEALHLRQDSKTSSNAPKTVLTRRERHKLRAQKYYERLDKMKADLEALQNSETSTLEQTVTLYYEPWFQQGFTAEVPSSIDGPVSTQSSVIPLNPTSNSEES